MAKWVCSVCGYVHEGDSAPEKCPQCGVPAEKFKKQDEDAEMTWASEHVVGVAQGCDPEIFEFLKAEFMGECSEVGMYLAMSRVAFREGYPEIGEYWRRAAFEEADHASRYAEMVGEVVTDSKNKTAMAKKAKELGLDAIHDSVHEMARDEARHGQAFAGLLKRYFG